VESRASYELGFEHPSHMIQEMREQSSSARTNLNYKSGNDVAPILLESILTIPSHIELHHLQAMPFRLAYHLLSADDGQPPPVGLIATFKPAIQVTLARQTSESLSIDGRKPR
jgi:hypothetical protein